MGVHGRVRNVAIGLAVIGTFACAAPAGAGTQVGLGTSKGLEYWKATSSDVVGQTNLQVNCDGDSEATGGGGAIKGAPAETVLNESYPVTPGPAAWTVEGSSEGAPQDMTGFAICAGVDTNVVTTDDDIPAGSSATQAAFCPDAQFVTGGGIQAASDGIRIEATYPPELQTDNWFGSAKNAAGVTLPVDYHAVCTDVFVGRYRSSDVVRVKSGESGKASAACKAKEAVLGGGFVGFNQGLPASGGWVNASRPRDSKKDRKKVPDDGWFASYRNDSVVTHRLVVFAVCKAATAPT
jgi:hypothetical protein